MIQARWKVIGYFELGDQHECHNKKKQVILCSIRTAIRYGQTTGRPYRIVFKRTKWIEHALSAARQREEQKRSLEAPDRWYQPQEAK